GVDDLYFSRLLNNLHGRRIFQSSTSYRTFNFTNVRFNLTGSFTGHIKAIFFTISQLFETLAPFLSNGDFEGDKTKTLPGRVPPLSSPICNGLGPHLLRPYLLGQYILQLLLRRLPGSEKTTWTTSMKSSTMSYSLDDLHVSRPESLKMDLPELPPRMFTLGEEPDAIRSISYHSDDTKLFKALCDCLTPDEFEDLKASKLGTIVKNFVQKDFDEMFPKWDGDVDDPAADNIIKVMFNDPGWEWTMECWPVTGTRKVVKMEVIPVKNEVSPVKSESVVKEESSRPRKKARKGSSVSAETPAAGSEGMTHQQIEKSLKDISDAINLGFGTCLKELKLLADRMVAVEKKVGITNRGGSSDDRQLTTTSNPPKPVDEPGVSTKTSHKIAEKRVTRQSVRKRQKEAKEPSLTTEPSSSRELCLVSPADDLPSDDPSLLILDKQVSTASDLLVEEARRQTKKETALVNLRKKSVRERKLAPTQQTPFKGNSTAKQIIPNKQVGGGYDPFAPIDKMKSKELTAWVQKDPSYKLPLKKKPRRCRSRFYQVLRTPLEWLTDHWRASYPDFKSDAPDANGLGRRLPGGAWNYHAGLIPSFCQSKKVWGVDVDDIYAPVNFKNQHWIAIWISIPKRHIVVWDSIVSHISPEELDEVMEPFLTMVPYLLVECTLSDEQKVQYTLEPYTYARQTVGVPQCRAGDCGPFTLKYIECHALGIEFPTAFDKKHGKTIREKMALDIFREFPMCHEWENQDNDENLA
ncbi:hypothetical protein IGI04_019775, partial [Brassica rapa subsp. trilocularis]